MTKGYVCAECGSQIVEHSKTDCARGKANLLFEQWWDEDGRYLDPDTSDVPWFDKRKELAGLAYMAGRSSVCRCELLEAGKLPLAETVAAHVVDELKALRIFGGKKS